MSTIDLNIENFDSTIADNEIVFIDFWADWCQPCKMFAPIYEKAAEEHPEIVFAKVNTEKNQELASLAQITAIPTLMAFREGVAIFRESGALPAPVFEDVVKQVKALDMDEVRETIAELEKEHGEHNH